MISEPHLTLPIQKLHPRIIGIWCNAIVLRETGAVGRSAEASERIHTRSAAPTIQHDHGYQQNIPGRRRAVVLPRPRQPGCRPLRLSAGCRPRPRRPRPKLPAPHHADGAVAAGVDAEPAAAPGRVRAQAHLIAPGTGAQPSRRRSAQRRSAQRRSVSSHLGFPILCRP